MSVTPIGDNTGYQPSIIQNVPETIFFNDILLLIFKAIGSKSFFETVPTLSRVCWQWKAVVEEDQRAWVDSFQRARVPLPLSSTTNLHKAFTEGVANLLRNKALDCHTPNMEEIDVNVDYLSNRRIKFSDDTHAITYNATEIRICDLVELGHAKEITTPAAIQSLCTVEGVIYCGLVSKQIVAYSVDDDQVAPLYTLNAHVDDQSYGSVQVLADEKWLISILGQTVKKWDRLTGKLIGTYYIKDRMKHIQLDGGKLYWIYFSSPEERSLCCLDLNKGGVSQKALPRAKEICKIQVHGNTCAFIKMHSPDQEAMDQEIRFRFRDSPVSEGSMFTMNLVTGVYNSTAIKVREFCEKSELFFFNEMVLLARPSLDQFKLMDKEITSLELININPPRTMHCLKKHLIHEVGGKKSLTVFKDTILYATKKNIVKVTFPQTDPQAKSLKRSFSEPKRNPDGFNKRRKLND